ncbi:Ethanolamine utilization protein EutD [Rhodobacteraceae bacterium SB2]|nr:phosphate acetyltransferase [Paracoccaceae bacterium]OAH08854.1 Ethanolamine utilization protein EutD [Rhodobacteraceae bacterium SB2]MBT5473950.1 phosphate acetyltransferase [Paracoccaceae bacterium]MBT6896401.1 phosphate acetyltransferase [Paracoccaceae bacterium]MCH1468225.1 phosphate acetyltransferase [Paracoccaceae bacterium]
MSVLENIFDRAKARAARVVLPEIEDPRIAEAAQQLRAKGLADPVPLSPVSDAMVAGLVERRGLKEAIARRMLAKPLFRAAAMVASGAADAMVAGADSPTKRVIEAASIVIGLRPGVRTPSSFFLMLFPDGRDMIFADCALNLAPDAGQLADIARASEQSAKALLDRVDMALLSFSTGASGSGESVDLVAAAAQETGFLGPIQADAALNPAIAAKKSLGQGQANVLIFPDLNAGNIAYKLAQELAGAQAIGPMLQGFSKPVCDLSRGASVSDIVAATAVTVALG